MIRRGQSAITVFPKKLVPVESDPIIEPVTQEARQHVQVNEHAPGVSQAGHDNKERATLLETTIPLDDKHRFVEIRWIPKMGQYGPALIGLNAGQLESSVNIMPDDELAPRAAKFANPIEQDHSVIGLYQRRKFFRHLHEVIPFLEAYPSRPSTPPRATSARCSVFSSKSCIRRNKGTNFGHARLDPSAAHP
jgi:hypothetical protein